MNDQIFDKFFRRNFGQLLGLDIGLDTVRLLQLEVSSTGVRVLQHGMEAFVAQDLQAMACALRKLRARHNFTTRYTALALADAQVMQREVEVAANSSDAEIFDTIELEAENYLLIPYSDAAVDFARNGVTSITVTAVSKQHLDPIIAAVESSGLIVKVVDLESCALARAQQQIAADFLICYGLALRSFSLC
ncbi:MAG: hypothetical protein COB50_02925 [Thiotrichales bacterium]|nr:MAG: hypothetical protein COB50_02925 [Thiotrichales bacterium]